MSYTFFYTDYCEGKSIPSEEAWDVDLDDFIHSMDCVLHMPNNFIGLTNGAGQTLQFIVEDDSRVTIDIPILKDNEYVRSKRKTTELSVCLDLVKNLSGKEDFYKLLPEEQDLNDQGKSWWKFW
ncbi:hypothetical protein [Agaribacter marinus]|uniref:Uncharacterized protein n=1 Tax=Agaribacter marinus TaxID=1431249 RepID=A0AA37SU53_9ALTE|nr:hypothetical protein [Agaribacter marinus]GLR69187.1 hypothetical protein GCM10007852_00950 [Agaribacter marinus]